MTKPRDLLIVGGGPVGLYAAIEAAASGLDVAVLEARPGVIDKACGEGLMPAAVDALIRAGVTIRRRHRFAGIRYIEGDVQASGRFREGEGWGIRRTELHRALRERVDALGIPVLRHRVKTLSSDSGGVTVDGYRARYLIAADGLRSPTRRHLALEVPPRAGVHRYGLRQHFRIAPWSEFVEVHWHALGEAYVTPVADDEVGVAFLFDDRSRGTDELSVDTLLLRFPQLAARLAAAARSSMSRGAGPFEQRSRRVVDGRVLLVGDAAGYLDPVTGEGLRLGFLAASAAVGAVREDRVETYEKAWRSLVRRYWWSTSALLALRRSPLRVLMMPALRHLPGLFDRVLDALGERSAAIHAAEPRCYDPGPEEIHGRLTGRSAGPQDNRDSKSGRVVAAQPGDQPGNRVQPGAARQTAGARHGSPPRDDAGGTGGDRHGADPRQDNRAGTVHRPGQPPGSQ